MRASNRDICFPVTRYGQTAGGLGRARTDDGLQEEKDRMDIYHKLFLVARREQLHSPLYTIPNLQHRPAKVLDIGCGTGIWVIDMAE